MTEKLTPYQRRLFVFLSVATFFEGYDFTALTQILPNFRADMGIGKDAAGFLIAFINAGLNPCIDFVFEEADRVRSEVNSSRKFTCALQPHEMGLAVTNSCGGFSLS